MQRAPAKIQIIPSSNKSVLNKLQLNTYPSSAIVMELACYPKRMSVKAVADRAPRAANYEADERQHPLVRPAKRIVFKESDVWWDILPEALQKGRKVEPECQRARTEGGGREHRNGAGSLVITARNIRLHPHSTPQATGKDRVRAF